MGFQLVDALDIAARQARLVHGETEIGLGQRVAGIHFVAIERHASFKAQGITRAETDRLDDRVGQQFVPQVANTLGREADLEAVFAGIARTRDIGDFAEKLERAALHEIHLSGGGAEFFHHVFGLGALQRQQCAVTQDFELDVGAGFIVGDKVSDDIEILILASGVDHQHKALGEGPRDHPVIEDAAVFTQQQRIFLLALG